jgi:hypothetical protein
MSCPASGLRASAPTIKTTLCSWAGWIASVWITGVLALVVMLNRQGCGAAPFTLGASVAASGWTLRHWLPVGHPLSLPIAEELIARGPLTGVRDEIYLVGSDPALSDRLRRAGWKVIAADFVAEPRVDILSPQQALKWSAGFRAKDFEAAGGTMMDVAVLARVMEGQYVAPYVPVGCAPPSSPSV